MGKRLDLYVFLTIIILSFFCIASFIPYAPAADEARAFGFTDDQIQTGESISFYSQLFYWCQKPLSVTLLLILILTPLGRRSADLALKWTRGYRVPAALLLGIGYLAATLVFRLPFGLVRFNWLKSIGIYSTEYTISNWLYDYALEIAVSLPYQVVIVCGFYAMLIWFPRVWWFLAPLGGGALGITYATLAPLLIDPLFNRFETLSQSQYRDLQPRVQKLIATAGIPVKQILVMEASRKASHTNAYFSGFGSSRQIVLYDTLLKNHSPEEVESVLAHEIGHWRHDHIVKGILLGIAAAFLGFWLLDVILRSSVGVKPLNMQSIADPAGIWLILQLLALGNLLVLIPENMISRQFEIQADVASLELAKNPDFFIECQRKMAIANKSNVAASPWEDFLFSSHPSTVQRIRMAQQWEEANSQKQP
jgi:STE24 endopeptidase